jgi:hypothetical protein
MVAGKMQLNVTKPMLLGSESAISPITVCRAAVGFLLLPSFLGSER